MSATVYLSKPLQRALAPHAGSRRLGVGALALRIVETAVREQLVDAVLDDGAPSSRTGASAALAAKEARIVELEEALGRGYQAPAEWRLARREQQIFGALVARERVSSEALHLLVWGDASDVDPSTVFSHVSKLKKKLRPFGVEIETQRHLGYRLVGRERFGGAA